MSQPPGTAADNSGRIVSGTRLADRYVVQEVAGYGGMATVYRGHDTLLDRNVAIKVLNQPLSANTLDRNAFLREARAAASLSHPGIAGVYDAGIFNGWPFIVMQYMPNGSLKDLIDTRAPLPADEAVEIAIALAEALEYGHRHNVVHCDVKPQNVLFDAERRPKLVDFGISQSAAATAAFTSTVNGTAGYVAPEQLEGLPLDGRADVYSLGTVLYEMLTARLPFEAANATALATRRLVVDPRPVREVNQSIPPVLAAIVMRSLARDREQRFASAAEFAGALRTFANGDEPTVATPFARYENTQVWRRPVPGALPDAVLGDRGRGGLFWALLALVAGVLVALVVVLFVVLSNRSSATASPTTAPQVVSTRLDDAARALQSAGLSVQVQLVSSDQPVGTVLAENPPAGTGLTTRDTVTLTVSGGNTGQ